MFRALHEHKYVALKEFSVDGLSPSDAGLKLQVSGTTLPLQLELPSPSSSFHSPCSSIARLLCEYTSGRLLSLSLFFCLSFSLSHRHSLSFDVCLCHLTLCTACSLPPPPLLPFPIHWSPRADAWSLGRCSYLQGSQDGGRAAIWLLASQHMPSVWDLGKGPRVSARNGILRW